MSNTVGSSVYSSANGSTSTLRPRNNRLISYLDESSSENGLSSQSASNSSSRRQSPSYTDANYHAGAQTLDRPARRTPSQANNDNTGRRPSSLWDSWNSIQGVASSLLSGGVDAPTTAGRKGSLKTPAWMKQDPKYKTATAAPEWGVASKDALISEPGSIEDRQALVQAKKREALLLSCTREGRDEIGRFKRKGSYDAGDTSKANDPGTDQDALVYKHKVQPGDTMAGVTIKYSCQPEAFRKVNRFWPNDKIQTRAYVLLPVEACSVRGRKVDDVTCLELLNDQTSKVDITSKQGPNSGRGERGLSSETSSAATSSKTGVVDDDELKHDSYVILPGFDGPIQILRIPQRLLGYFPRARRKSNPNTSDPIASTPKNSFDMLRHPPTHAAQQAAAALNPLPNPQSLSLNASPVRQHTRPPTRSRSSSTTTASTNTNNAWFLRGPGGVGSLSGLRTQASRPGPSEDPLNQRFTQYFPSLAIPTTDPDSNIIHPSALRHATSRSPYRSTPRASIDSIRSTRSNSSTFGAGVAGVENFMRKLATGKRPDGLPRTNSGNFLIMPAESGLGDLIELETKPDALNSSSQGRGPGFQFGREGRDEDDDATPTESLNHEDLLNERFPVRGRVTRAYRPDES